MEPSSNSITNAWILRGFLLLICLCSSTAGNSFPLALCNNESYTTPGSDLDSNYMQTLIFLENDLSDSGFNIYSYASSSNSKRVYAMVECRADAETADCFKCAAQAKAAFRNSCGNAVGARIWMELCFMRWDIVNFSGTIDQTGFYNVSSNNVSSPAVFDRALRELVSKLINLTLIATAGQRYAFQSSTDNASQEIYALVQCWRDISRDYCELCLDYAFEVLMAHSYGRGGGWYYLGSCILRYDTYQFYNERPVTPYSWAKSPPPPPSSPPPPEFRSLPPVPLFAASPPTAQEKGDDSTLLVVVSVQSIFLAFLLLLVVFLLLVVLRRRSNNRQILQSRSVFPYQPPNLSLDNEINGITFTLQDIISATKSFDDLYKLGVGGFGDVYKGYLPDGRTIAVKRLRVDNCQDNTDFINEVQVLTKIQHRNLVKLLGCCTEGTQRMLVCEYMANNSLDKFLTDSSRRAQLDWRKRQNIIMGVAQGLLYLHKFSRTKIIHRDIKASNILLDDNFHPKIADFGLAKIFPDDHTCIKTAAAGTLGYIAPEYLAEGKLSLKVDVYSFGVLTLEIVAGRKNIDRSLPDETQNLLRWAWELYEEQSVLAIVDAGLHRESRLEELTRTIHVALLCTQGEPSVRPTMSELVLMLSSPSLRLPLPAIPPFPCFTSSGIPCSSENAPSINTLSFSLEGR